MFSQNGSEMTKGTLFFIDSAQEIKVGVGLNNWPIVYLKDGDAIVPKATAKYVGIEKGDEFSLALELG